MNGLSRARRSGASAILIVAAGAIALAQQGFRGGTEVVVLAVTVQDDNNRLVAGLDQPDFEVYEDNVRQETSYFSRQPQPTALSLVMDTSVSMEPRLGMTQDAAAGFVRRLGPQDVAQVLSFNSSTEILVEFTQDKEALERAIRRTQASGSTSLYNALYTSLRELQRIRAERGADIRRQALVLLSDGQDTTSVIRYEDVLDLAKRSEVVIYAIGLRDKPSSGETDWKENEYVLGQLTKETGGRTFFVSDASGLPAIYAQIADELSNQYTLGYVSKNTRRDGSWRKIYVRVARGGMTARTKAGYFSPRASR